MNFNELLYGELIDILTELNNNSLSRVELQLVITNIVRNLIELRNDLNKY